MEKTEFEAVSSCRNLSELQRVIGSGSGVACRDVLVRENVNQIVENLTEHWSSIIEWKPRDAIMQVVPREDVQFQAALLSRM